jgi:hypothetical protein
MARGTVKGFLALPSDLDLQHPDAVAQINDALRRVAAQTAPDPAPVLKPAPADNVAQIAYCSAALTLVTGTYNDITGATLTLDRAGRYLILGCFDFLGFGAGDLNIGALGRLVADGTAQAPLAMFSNLVIAGGVSQRSTVCQQWLYTAAATGQVVKLQAEKNGGTGASQASSQSSISALWIGP